MYHQKTEKNKTGISGCGWFLVHYFQLGTSIDRLRFYSFSIFTLTAMFSIAAEMLSCRKGQPQIQFTSMNTNFSIALKKPTFGKSLLLILTFRLPLAAHSADFVAQRERELQTL